MRLAVEATPRGRTGSGTGGRVSGRTGPRPCYYGGRRRSSRAACAWPRPALSVPASASAARRRGRGADLTCRLTVDGGLRQPRPSPSSLHERPSPTAYLYIQASLADGSGILGPHQVCPPCPASLSSSASPSTSTSPIPTGTPSLTSH